MRQLMDITPAGSAVLDPFMGSGTTGEATVLDGRKFVGIELSEHSVRQATARIADAEQTVRGRTEGGAP
ncbi:site-specific DNA-methyltransferase [Actinomadura madurae]